LPVTSSCAITYTFVTTGLDPVVHAEARLRKSTKIKQAATPHGLPGQARQ
jgi:hypothetical protein